MKHRRWLLLVWLLRIALAHELCGTRDPDDNDKLEMKMVQEDYLDGGEERRLQQFQPISVYFHSYIETEDQQLTTRDIQPYMAALKDGYRGTGFTFRLESVQNYVDPTNYACVYDNRREFIGNVRVGGDADLNVIICDSYSDFQQTGYSSWPTQKGSAVDGVVVQRPDTPGFEPVDSYYALVHEVGHWLGLLHTFSQGCSAKAHTVSGMRFSDGDGVDDTPAHAGPTWDEAGRDQCWRTTPPLDTCPDRSSIDAGVDPVTNYMNYVSGECWRRGGSFTTGQVSRLNAIFARYRLGISNGGGSGPSSNNCRSRGQSCRSSSDCCSRRERCVADKRRRHQEKRKRGRSQARSSIATLSKGSTRQGAKSASKGSKRHRALQLGTGALHAAPRHRRKKKRARSPSRRTCQRACGGVTRRCESQADCCSGLECVARTVLAVRTSNTDRYCTRP